MVVIPGLPNVSSQRACELLHLQGRETGSLVNQLPDIPDVLSVITGYYP